jgi:hypothetical protein
MVFCVLIVSSGCGGQGWQADGGDLTISSVPDAGRLSGLTYTTPHTHASSPRAVPWIPALQYIGNAVKLSLLASPPTGRPCPRSKALGDASRVCAPDVGVGGGVAALATRWQQA